MADKIEYGSSGNMMVIDAIRKAQEKDSTVTFEDHVLRVFVDPMVSI